MALADRRAVRAAVIFAALLAVAACAATDWRLACLAPDPRAATSLIFPLAELASARFPWGRAKPSARSPDSPRPEGAHSMTQQILDHADGDLTGLFDGVSELSAPAAHWTREGGLWLPPTGARTPDAPAGPATPVPEAVITAAPAPDAAAPRDGRRWRFARKNRRPVPVPVPASAAEAEAAGTGMVRTVFSVASLSLALAVVAAAAAYLTFPHAGVFSKVHGTVLAALVPAGALAAIIAVVAAWRAARRQLEGRKSADVLTVLAAIVAMTVSATGMWAFFERYVPTVPVLIRIPIFAFLEISTLAEALRSRDNMREEVRRALEEGREPDSGLDIDGLAMWVLTGISAFLASLASTTVAEALFRLAPPLVAAWMWERALVSERRRTVRGKRKKSTWRISPERILVLLGVIDPAGKTTGEVAAQRRITILALAAEQAAALESVGIGPGDRRRDRADRKLRAALRRAVDEADLATNRDRQVALVAQLRILRAPQDLVTLDTESPWAQLVGPRRPQREDRRRDEERRDDRRRDEDREEGKDDRRDDRRQDGGGDGSPLALLADALSVALRQQDADQVHALLAGRDDYAALVHWLGRNGKFGAKRLMAVAAMYAVPGTMTSPAKGTAWVAGIVPGKQGEVDKAEIRRLRELIEPVWTAKNYPGPAATGGGKDDTQE